MNTLRIVVSTSAWASHWQLCGILGTPTSILLGWCQTPAPVDAGVPGDVADLLSRALCRGARVSFLATRPDDIAARHVPGSYSIRPLAGRGVLNGRLRRWLGQPADVALVSSSDPGVVRRLFEDEYLAWVLQGQYVFLSAASDLAPELGDVLSKAWRRRCEEAAMRLIEDHSLTGILRPGVDGDVAGILFRSDAHRESFLAALREEAEKDGMPLAICGEAEFMELLAGESQHAARHAETRGV